MNKIISAIKKPEAETKENFEKAYKRAVDNFVNDKKDVDVDTLRKVLKAISALSEAKEKEKDRMEDNFYEQTEVKKRANHLFE